MEQYWCDQWTRAHKKTGASQAPVLIDYLNTSLIRGLHYSLPIHRVTRRSAIGNSRSPWRRWSSKAIGRNVMGLSVGCE